MPSQNNYRLNLTIPQDLLEQIRKCAKDRFKAKIHHISKQPEITETLLKLLEIGLDNLNQQDEIVYEGEKPVSLKAKYEGLQTQFWGLADNVDKLTERVKQLENYAHNNTDNTQIDSRESTLTTIPDSYTDSYTESKQINNQELDSYVHSDTENIQIKPSLPTSIPNTDSYTESTQIDSQEIDSYVLNYTETTHIDNQESYLTSIPDSYIHTDTQPTHIDNQDLDSNTDNDTEIIHIKTMKRAEMAKYRRVNPSTVGRWIKDNNFKKIPVNWTWNPTKEVFEKIDTVRESEL